MSGVRGKQSLIIQMHAKYLEPETWNLESGIGNPGSGSFIRLRQGYGGTSGLVHGFLKPET